MKLIIEDDEGRRTVVPFARQEITIGRDEGNTIRLTERNVSRKHARIVRVNGHVEVEDLGSYNGIRINGERIQGKSSITERDLIQIGDYDLAIEQDSASAGVPVAPGTLSMRQTSPSLISPAIGPPPLPAVETAAPEVSAPVLLLPEEARLTEAPPLDPDALPPALPPEIDPANPRRQSTSVIRLDVLEAQRGRAVVDLSPEDAPQLVVLNSGFAGKVFVCRKTELQIGRGEENEVALDHRSLSRTHAKLIREDGGEWRIIDMQSANGVLVNGEGYAQASLHFGDVVELGHVKMRFEGPGGELDTSLGRLWKSLRRRARAVGVTLGLVVLLLGGLLLRPHPGPSPVASAPATSAPIASAPATSAPVASTPATSAPAASAPVAPSTASSHPPPPTTHEVPARPSIRPAMAALTPGLVTGHSTHLPTPTATPGKAHAPGREVASAHAPPVVTTPAATPPSASDPSPRDLAERLYGEGKALHKKQQLREAELTFKRCLSVDPGYARCHMMLGSTYALLKDFDRGAYHYRKFVEMAPDDSNAERVRQLLQKYDENVGQGKPAQR